MGICAQQFRLCVGLYAASKVCSSLIKGQRLFDWFEAFANCFDLARAALYLTVLIVIFTYGLFEIDNACHSENNYEDCIPPIKHPLIDSFLGITDILTVLMFFKKFRFKLPIIKVLLTTSCFTLFS